MTYRSLRIDGRHHVIMDCGSFDTAKEAHDCVTWLNELEDQAETHKRNIDKLEQQLVAERQKLADYVAGLQL